MMYAAFFIARALMHSGGLRFSLPLPLLLYHVVRQIHGGLAAHELGYEADAAFAAVNGLDQSFKPFERAGGDDDAVVLVKVCVRRFGDSAESQKIVHDVQVSGSELFILRVRWQKAYEVRLRLQFLECSVVQFVRLRFDEQVAGKDGGEFQRVLAAAPDIQPSLQEDNPADSFRLGFGGALCELAFPAGPDLHGVHHGCVSAVSYPASSIGTSPAQVSRMNSEARFRSRSVQSSAVVPVGLQV